MTLLMLVLMLVAFISVCGMLTALILTRMKLRYRLQENSQQNDGLAARLEEVEKRLENIEAIMVEQEKHRSFDEELLHAGSQR